MTVAPTDTPPPTAAMMPRTMAGIKVTPKVKGAAMAQAAAGTETVTIENCTNLFQVITIKIIFVSLFCLQYYPCLGSSLFYEHFVASLVAKRQLAYPRILCNHNNFCLTENGLFVFYCYFFLKMGMNKVNKYTTRLHETFTAICTICNMTKTV